MPIPPHSVVLQCPIIQSFLSSSATNCVFWQVTCLARLSGIVEANALREEALERLIRGQARAPPSKAATFAPTYQPALLSKETSPKSHSTISK